MTLRQDLATSALTDLLFEEPGAARCLVAPDDSVLRVNAAWLRAAGVSLDDALGADVADLLPEARHAALDLRARARSGHRVALPRHVRTIDGRETWWEGSVAPVPMEDGTGLLVTVREVERPSAPPASASPPQEKAPALELLELDDAFCELDREYRVVRVNARQEQLTGMPRAQSLGKTHWELWPESARPESPWWREYHRCMEERVPVAFENYYAPLGLWSDVTAHPTSSGGIAIFFRDVTAWKRADRAEAERDRLATQRQLALDAARMGWWHYDPATRVATCATRSRRCWRTRAIAWSAPSTAPTRSRSCAAAPGLTSSCSTS